ncbi:hypothetical protein Btru_062023 [Bulinus truncatus]|nr:hypothetical protein Btru_062023 [Bulinus truncatus]
MNTDSSNPVSNIDNDDQDIVHRHYAKFVFEEQQAKNRTFSFDATQIVLPVNWGKLSSFTFNWYVNNIHRSSNYLNVCHMPDFRAKIKLGMSAPEVLETMREVEVRSLELKRLYESLMEEKKIHGRFIRIGGNTVWNAILEFCRLVHPAMIVMGSKTLTVKVNAPENSPSRKGAGSFVSTVTSDVLMHSYLPVVIVRMPSPEETIVEENNGNIAPVSKTSKKQLKKYSTP